MKKIILCSLIACTFGISSVFATPDTKTPMKGEFSNHCAMGLTTGQEVPTNCEINLTDPTTHKTYCFSTDAAKVAWEKNSVENLAKATLHFSKNAAARAIDSAPKAPKTM